MNRRVIRITIAFVGVIGVVSLVWLFCYRPNFGSEFARENADWGNLGQFFFGLGALLVAIVTAYIMLGIDTQLHRSNMIKLYEKTLRRFRNSINKELKMISPYEMTSAYMDMYGVLTIIEFDNNFSYSVNKRAAKLFKETLRYKDVILSIYSYLVKMNNHNKPDDHYVELYNQLVELISNLSAFLICLSNNDGEFYKEILDRYEKTGNISKIN